jgi:hypothetical protein
MRLGATPSLVVLLGCVAPEPIVEPAPCAAGDEVVASTTPLRFTRVLVDSGLEGRDVTRVVWLLESGGAVWSWRSTAPTALSPLGSEAVYTDLALADGALCGLRDDGGVECWPIAGDALPTEVLGAGRVVRFRWGRETGCVEREESLDCWFGLSRGAEVTGWAEALDTQLADEIVCFRGWEHGDRTRCVDRRTATLVVDRGERCVLDARGRRGGPPTLVLQCWRETVVVRSLTPPEIVERPVASAVDPYEPDTGPGCVAAGSTATCTSTNRVLRPMASCEHGYMEHVSGLGHGCDRDSRGLFGLGERIVDIDDDGEAACAVLVSGTVTCWGGGGDVVAGREVAERGLRWLENDDCRAERQCWSLLTEISALPASTPSVTPM